MTTFRSFLMSRASETDVLAGPMLISGGSLWSRRQAAGSGHATSLSRVRYARLRPSQGWVAVACINSDWKNLPLTQGISQGHRKQGLGGGGASFKQLLNFRAAAGHQRRWGKKEKCPRTDISPPPSKAITVMSLGVAS